MFAGSACSSFLGAICPAVTAVLLCPMQQVGLSVNLGDLWITGAVSSSLKKCVWSSSRVTRASGRAVMGKCSGVSLVTLEIKGDFLTLLVQFFRSRDLWGMSSFLWAGKEGTVSVLSTALLARISGRLRVTASVVVPIYRGQAPLNTIHPGASR